MFAGFDWAPERSCHPRIYGGNDMTQSVVARLAALKTTTTPGLKALWRDLFGKEPPPYNRRFLESRLGYRIQELAYGGLRPETVERLDALADQFSAPGKIRKGKRQ